MRTVLADKNGVTAREVSSGEVFGAGKQAPQHVPKHVKVRQLDQEIVNTLAGGRHSRHSLLPLLSKKISMKSLERSLTRLRKERRVDFSQVGKKWYWYTRESYSAQSGAVVAPAVLCYDKVYVGLPNQRWQLYDDVCDEHGWYRLRHEIATEGFVTDDDEFLTREQAYTLAEISGQFLSQMPVFVFPDKPKLFDNDIWRAPRECAKVAS